MKRTIPFLIVLFFAGSVSFGQSFTMSDSLRGMLNPFRTCYDVTFYDLSIAIDTTTKSIAGTNVFHFKARSSFQKVQIDLFENMQIDQIKFENQELDFERRHNAVMVSFPRVVKVDEAGSFTVAFSGTPTIARNPPWDGGFSWEKDRQNRPWIGVSCEGIGASLWWPLKDHLSDEPDSMKISCTVPAGLMCISNGQLRREYSQNPGTATFEWFVSYPINSYNVTLNIANYAHIKDEYKNASGSHNLDYYVLDYNEVKAREHFQQVKPMLECYEELFGEYPFWEDGYALVETPYWGMEHQGAIAYGNNYHNNPFGFDFIIVHESGHEWWGNSVGCKDHAELWIHESFCTYGEALYLECTRDYKTAVDYLVGQRARIANRSPMVGPMNVNYKDWKDSDIYFKGTWMLHSLRNSVPDTAKVDWHTVIKKFHEAHKLSQITTEEVISFFNLELKGDYSYHFKQYLYHKEPPVLEYELKRKGKDKVQFRYRWIAAEEDFRMPLQIRLPDGKPIMIHPTTTWQTESYASEPDLSPGHRMFYFLEKELGKDG